MLRIISNSPRSRALPCLFLALLLAIAAPGQQQDTIHRIILKDGSYQLATKYEVKGDRVHYYSSEREDWEDLPNSLVDWPATGKYEQGHAAEAPEAVQLDKELEHENELAEAKLPQVAPGLRIPEDSGVFLLDNFESQPELLELHPAEGDVDQQSKGNIFRDAITPIAGLKAVIQIDGPHAAIQAHVDVPSLYLNIDAPNPVEQAKSSQQPQAPISDRYRILRVEIKGNKRILGNLKRQVGGKVTQEQHLMKSTTTQLAGGWLKLTPSESLAPGEYAVVEMMGKEGMNLYVYDFGINPKAPANPNPWKPEVKPAAKPTNP